MSIRLGDVAPDFTPNTTAGVLSLHEYLRDGCGTLFSGAANFAPVNK